MDLWYTNRHPRGDVDSAAYYDAAGYSDPPDRLPTAEFEQYEGLVVEYRTEDADFQSVVEQVSEFWRGVRVYDSGNETSPEDYYRQFVEGDLFVGTGIFGPGVYVGDKRAASWFADHTSMTAEPGEIIGGKGIMWRMKIKRDAIIVDWQDFVDRAAQEGVPIRTSRTEYSREIRELAVELGIDGINATDSWDDKAGLIIFNRNALVVEDLYAEPS
jgi:hypothetical protein